MDADAGDLRARAGAPRQDRCGTEPRVQPTHARSDTPRASHLAFRSAGSLSSRARPPYSAALMTAPASIPFAAPPSARHRGVVALRDRRAPRPRRRLCRAQPPGRQEAVGAARAHPDQRLLRVVDPHPHLVRAGRQAARRRHHQHVDRGIRDQEGRDPDRHRDDPQRHASGRARGAAPRERRRRAAVAEGRLRGRQRRRRQPRAPDPGPARRVDDPAPARQARRAPHRHLRRRAAQPGRALQHPPAQRHGRGIAGRRSADAAAARGRAPRRGRVHRHARRTGRLRHHHDAAPADRAHARLVRPVGARVLRPLRPRPREAGAGQARRPGDASRTDEPRRGDRHRDRRRYRSQRDPRAGRDGGRRAHGMPACAAAADRQPAGPRTAPRPCSKRCGAERREERPAQGVRQRPSARSRRRAGTGAARSWSTVT